MSNDFDRFNGQEPPECNANDYTFYYKAEGELTISATNLEEAKELFNNTPMSELFEEVIMNEIYKEDRLIEKADFLGRMCKVDE